MKKETVKHKHIFVTMNKDCPRCAYFGPPYNEVYSCHFRHPTPEFPPLPVYGDYPKNWNLETNCCIPRTYLAENGQRMKLVNVWLIKRKYTNNFRRPNYT